jgi:ribonuclease HII
MISYELDCTEQLIAGVDEVGRGALFGGVVAGAAIFPKAILPKLYELGIKDSKKLSATRREELAPEIEAQAIAFAIGVATVAEIDELNILKASLLAMKRSIAGLSAIPELCLIDGNRRVVDLELPQQTLIKGEDRSISIAAASILAKVWRDRAISDLSDIYPHYDLAHNKGYGTAKHLRAIEQYGICSEHRRSFSPVRNALAAASIAKVSS